MRYIPIVEGRIFILWLTSLAWAEESTASDSDSLESDGTIDGTIIVEDKAPESSASTTIIIDNTIPVTDTLGNILQRQSSVFIREMGGMGTTSTLSIRGTSTRQNLMVLNGIPLNPNGVSSVNLQDIPAQMLKNITLYRSHTPLGLMSSAMGGVIDMKTHTQSTPLMRGTIDSWLNGHIEGHTPFANTMGHGNIFVSGLQAQNAYPYFDNRNTSFNAEDDTWRTRSNNDVTQLQGLATWTMNGLDVLHSQVYREQGIPGHIIIPTPDIRLQNTRRLTGIHSTESNNRWSHDSTAWWSTQSEIFQDPMGNLGQGSVNQEWTFQMIGGRTFHRWIAKDTWFPSLGGTMRRDHARLNNDSPYERWALNGQAGSELILEQVEWNWSLQSHWLSSQPNQINWVPKTSLLWNLSTQDHMWLSMVGGFRPPDFTELYGNRGAVIGNPNLTPETGRTLDTGWTHNNTAHWLNRIQIGGYWRESKNEIIFVQNAQRQSIPLNFEATRVVGLEGEWEINIEDQWMWSGSVSFTHSTNLADITGLYGNHLPNLPRWMSGQQVWWMSDPIWIGTDVYFSDGNYWDANNQKQAPTRLIHNATIRWTSASWSVEATGRNLWNRIVVNSPIDSLNPELGLYPEAVQDFLGYPLMGRSVVLSVTWKPTEQVQTTDQ